MEATGMHERGVTGTLRRLVTDHLAQIPSYSIRPRVNRC